MPGGPTCCATAAPAATPASSTSTGTAGDKVLLPILGKPLAETLAAGEIAAEQETLRYFSHRLPLAPDSAGARDVLERQHYRLAWWRSAGDRINWRRFFDINELVCLRMEDDGGLRGRARADRCGSMPRA